VLLAAALWAAASSGAEPAVGITAELMHVDVAHAGKTVRIAREQDSFGQIDPDFAMTSRPCPPYCIQPMRIAPGVETVGELELLDHLKRAANGDVLVIDSREPDWLVRSGVIPGAVHLPWERLHPRHADAAAIADILQLQFGASLSGQLWNFENAKTLVFYCNGIWCGQSPTSIRQLLALGYPAHKLKWYRGGMQAWKSLGLTTAPWKP
jgi:rhodanese-related sulfurtransferase